MTIVIEELADILMFLSLLEEFEDTKWVIRIRKSKENRQHNGQNKKDKQRSTKHTHKTKDATCPQSFTKQTFCSMIFKLMEETKVPGENHRTAARHLQTLSRVVSSTLRYNSQLYCIGSCKLN
jgi:hypothetical protein